jgi:hypothetical protein
LPRKNATNVPAVKDLTASINDWERGEEVDAVSIRPMTLDCLTDKMRHPRHSKQDAVPRRARTPQFDGLGLPPRPLVLKFDLLHYMAFKRAHQSARKEEYGKDEMILERELVSTSGSNQHGWPDVPYHSPPAMSLIDSPLE